MTELEKTFYLKCYSHGDKNKTLEIQNLEVVQLWELHGNTMTVTVGDSHKTEKDIHLQN